MFEKQINPFQDYIFFTSGGIERAAEEIVFVTMKVIFKDGNGKSDSRFAKARAYYNEHYNNDRALRGKIPVNSSEVDNNKLEKNVLPAVKKFIINHRKFKPGKKRVKDLKKTLKDTSKITLDKFLEYLEAYKERHSNDTFLSGVTFTVSADNRNNINEINEEKIKRRAEKLLGIQRSKMDDKFINQIAKDFKWIENNKATKLKGDYGEYLKTVVRDTATDDVKPLLKKSELTVTELKPHYKRLKHLLKIVDEFEIKSQDIIPNCKEILEKAKNKLNEIDATRKAYKNLLEVIGNGINNDIKKLQQGKMLEKKDCQIKQLENHLIGFIGTVSGELDKIYSKIRTPMSSLVIRYEKFENDEEIAKVLTEVGQAALDLVGKLKNYCSEKKVLEKKVNKLTIQISSLFNNATRSLDTNMKKD